MAPSNSGRRRTRREFLGDVARLGLGAAVLAAVGPQAVRPALAKSGPPERVKVLMADLVESSAADFARGRARGVEIASEAGHAVLRGSRGAEFTSGVVMLPFAATHVGLHWIARGNSPQDLAVDVRTSVDGAAWSDWQPLSIEAVADQAGGREVFAALKGADRGRFAQYRVTFRSDQTTTLNAMTVTAINSVDGPREPLATAAATTATLIAASGNITVVTREGWGCDETLRFRRKTELWPEMYVPAKKAVLHHTASSNTYTDGAAEVRAIYAYHARTLRWGDIGYNSLIDLSGNIYEGRHGRGEDPSTREILSADVVAGHVYHHNYGSTGFAAIGDFDQGTPTDALLASIDKVATFECDRHSIDPKGVSDFLRSDDQWHPDLDNVSGHYQSYNTSCPGANLISYLPDLREHVASSLGGNAAPTLTGAPAPSTSTALSTPATLSFSWSGAPGPYEYCLEGWYKPSSSDDVTYLQGYVLDGQYSDPLAERQFWRDTTAATLTFKIDKAGHYTMHVRSTSGKYEANLTYLVTAGTSTKPHGKK